MIKWEKETIELEHENAEKMPFFFQGISKYDEEITIDAQGTCGCTTIEVVIPFEQEGTDRLEMFPAEQLTTTLKPNQTFKVRGYMKERKALGKHTKSINVHAKSKGKVLSTTKLEFTINVL